MQLLKKLGLLSLLFMNQVSFVHGMEVEKKKDQQLKDKKPLVLGKKSSCFTDKDGNCRESWIFAAACFCVSTVVTAAVIGGLSNSTEVANNSSDSYKVCRKYGYNPERCEYISEGERSSYPHGSGWKHICVQSNSGHTCFSNKDLNDDHGCLGRHLVINNGANGTVALSLKKCGAENKDKRRLRGSVDSPSGFKNLSDFMNKAEIEKYQQSVKDSLK